MKPIPPHKGWIEAETMCHVFRILRYLPLVRITSANTISM